MTHSPLNLSTKDAFHCALKNLPQADKSVIQSAKNHQDSLTKPQGSLGKLEEIALFIAGWQKNKKPTLDKVSCLVFAGNHGVTEQGVSAFPSEVTTQMVHNFTAGGAAINQLCTLAQAKLTVIPLELENPTKDFSQEAALSAEEVCKALQIGADAVDPDLDCLLLGEMGIGNTTSAAALSHALFGGNCADWVGKGTGIEDERLQHKVRIVSQSVALHQDASQESFDLLRTLGGREIIAIAGAVIQARHYNIPVLLDGYICTAAAACLTKSAPDILDHCLISHLSVEIGHQHLAKYLHKEPILHLDMRLGEASGAAVALLILRAALVTHNGMASFEEAQVSTSKSDDSQAAEAS